MLRLALLLITLLVPLATAQNVSTSPTISEPPDWHLPENLKASVTKEMLSTLRISNYSIKLEHTKMEDLEKHFGGQLGSKGDAGDSVQWVCFHGFDKSGNWVLWLESGEIDGGYVGSFEWRRMPESAVIDHRCVAIENPPDLPISLALGIREDEVLKILGRPSWKDQGRLIYLHEREESINGQPYDSSNIVMVRLHAGLVWSIAVSKTTSS